MSTGVFKTYVCWQVGCEKDFKEMGSTVIFW